MRTFAEIERDIDARLAELAKEIKDLEKALEIKNLREGARR